MSDCGSAKLLAILHETLEAIDADPELRPDDPTVLEFKRSVEFSIAELERPKAA